MTKIEWTDITWNPTTGCSKISEGCKNCYAERMAHRHKDNPKMNGKYRNEFKVTCHPEELKRNFGRKPKKIFINSMSDIFHKDIPYEFVERVINKAKFYSEHTFQILTKRPVRMAYFFDCYHGANVWPRNVWMGVTVENAAMAYRIDCLRSLPAGVVKFISFEPLLEDIGMIDLSGIHWVIIGAETGPGARFMETEWAISLIMQSRANDIPIFVKKLSKGTWLPEDLKPKDFPKGVGC